MIYWENQEANEVLLQVLNNDGVVLAQSDTVLGLFAQLSEIAKKKLDSIKVRNFKPYIVMIASKNVLESFIDQKLDDAMVKIIDTHWPGPLTIIFKASKNLPDWLINSLDNTIAIRVPDHCGLQKLLKNMHALFTTSANISGQPLPATIEECDSSLMQQVDLVCQSRDLHNSDQASTILDFSKDTITVVRFGVVKIDSI